MSRIVTHPSWTAPPVNPPAAPAIYQTSSWRFADLDQLDAVFAGSVPAAAEYGTVGHPNNLMFESVVSELEGAEAAIVSNGGMASISSVLLSELRSGDRVLIGREGFGSTVATLRDLAVFGVEPVIADLHDTEAVQEELRQGAAMIWAETISNPRVRVPDLGWLAEQAHARGALLVVDNTFATPSTRGRSLSVRTLLWSL